VIAWPEELFPVLLVATDDTLFNVTLFPIFPCFLVARFFIEFCLQAPGFRQTSFVGRLLGSELHFEFPRFK
jgi:hypothetical protein